MCTCVYVCVRETAACGCACMCAVIRYNRSFFYIQSFSTTTPPMQEYLKRYVEWKLCVEPDFAKARGVMGREAEAFARILKNYMPRLAEPAKEGEEEEGMVDEEGAGGKGPFANVTSDAIRSSLKKKLDNNWRQPRWRRSERKHRAGLG